MYWIWQVGYRYVACWPFPVMLCYAAITGTLLCSWTATAVFSGIWLIHNLLTSVGRFFVASAGDHSTTLKSLLFLTLQCIYYLVWAFDFRPNLYLSVASKSPSMANDLCSVMTKTGRKWRFDGPTVIYCPTRKATEMCRTVLQQSESVFLRKDLP